MLLFRQRSDDGNYSETGKAIVLLAAYQKCTAWSFVKDGWVRTGTPRLNSRNGHGLANQD